MRARTHSALFALSLAAFSAAGGAYACGTERWPVKVGDDPDGPQVDLTRSVTTTLEALDALAPPAVRPADARVGDTERTLFVVHATLTAYKLESDGDYHLALSDDAGHTLIAEIPDPACVGASSPFLAGIRKARAAFEARLKAGPRYRTTALQVTVTGVGFFDFDHGQRGVAPNAIELHPVLDLSFD